jgi:hypothetical protein
VPIPGTGHLKECVCFGVCSEVGAGLGAGCVPAEWSHDRVAVGRCVCTEYNLVMSRAEQQTRFVMQEIDVKDTAARQRLGDAPAQKPPRERHSVGG